MGVRRMRLRLPLLYALSGMAFVAALLLGPAGIGPLRILDGLLHPSSPGSEAVRTLVYDLRLPRGILAALVGAGLGVSGALLQAYFQNPMAGPYVIGVSSGAGLGVAILSVATGAASPSGASLPIAALLGGLAVVALVTTLAGRARGRRTETLLLVGMAVAAVCSAIMSVLLLHLPRGPEGVLFWLMGSLAGASWGGTALVGAGVVIGLALGFWHARGLDAILWGDEVARSVGVDVKRTRAIILLAATVPVAASVATCGVIGFLGLMAPHIARGICGPGHRKLLPLSALIGAGWLLAADLLARLLMAPMELPVGAITSAVGAPFLVWICLRRRPTWDSSGSTRRRSSPRDKSSLPKDSSMKPA
jgi:iron complex transport system permease protein